MIITTPILACYVGQPSLWSLLTMNVDILCVIGVWQVYIHGGSFMLGGYVGAGLTLIVIILKHSI